MSGDEGSEDQYQGERNNPAVLQMIADNLDERANTLQAEAQRLGDEADQLREMADDLSS